VERGNQWVSGQPGIADAACVFGGEDAREVAGKGYEIVSKVNDEFGSIAQDIYFYQGWNEYEQYVILGQSDQLS